MTISQVIEKITLLREIARAEREEMRKGGSQKQRFERKLGHLSEYYTGQEVAFAEALQMLERIENGHN